MSSMLFIQITLITPIFKLLMVQIEHLFKKGLPNSHLSESHSLRFVFLTNLINFFCHYLKTDFFILLCHVL